MTHRIRLLVLAAGALAALASPAVGLAQTRLVATVADPSVITLRTEAGANVTDLPAGTYTIEVRDQSSNHNFHLSGPGVNEATDVEFVGTRTWTVTLQDRSRYTYVCDPHASFMRGSFTVGGGPPNQPPPPPPPRTRVQTIYATVGPGASISLRTHHGARITRLTAGRYRIVVRDRSNRHNFHLTGPGMNKRTTVGYRGTTTWTVTLRRGRYRFVCDPHARHMRGGFRVV